MPGKPSPRELIGAAIAEGRIPLVRCASCLGGPYHSGGDRRLTGIRFDGGRIASIDLDVDSAPPVLRTWFEGDITHVDCTEVERADLPTTDVEPVPAEVPAPPVTAEGSLDQAERRFF